MGGVGGPSNSSGKLLNAWDGYLCLPQSFWNSFFAFLVVFGQVGQNVSLPIWFASVPDPDDNHLDPLFILTFAGLAFVIIFGLFWCYDIYRGETTLQESLFYLNRRYLKRYLMAGFSNGIGGMMLVFSAARCAPFFQAILGTTNILWTLILRAMYLGELPTPKQALLASCVYLGLFLASVPSVFGMETGGAFKTDGKGIWKLLWPMLFALAYIPFAWMNVVGEEVLKETTESQAVLINSTDKHGRSSYSTSGRGSHERIGYSHKNNTNNNNSNNNNNNPATLDECAVFSNDSFDGLAIGGDGSRYDSYHTTQLHSSDHHNGNGQPRRKVKHRTSSLVGDPFGSDDDCSVNIWWYLTLTSIAQELLFFAFFWIDCLPTFGTTDDAWKVDQIFDNLNRDWKWFVGMDGASINCTVRALVFVGSYTITNLGFALMLRYTDGATWVAIIGAVVTPAGGIFWLIFSLDDNHFSFKPVWHVYSLYIFAGLFVMCPSIYYYDKACQELDEDIDDMVQFTESHKNDKNNAIRFNDRVYRYESGSNSSHSHSSGETNNQRNSHKDFSTYEQINS